GSPQGSTDPRVKQALDRLRQASDDMRKAAAPGQSPADARRAAERLKEASNLLGGVKQNQSSGQLDATAREADRLTAEQRKQAEQMRQMFGGGATDSSGQPQPGAGTNATPQQQRQLADDRQQLAEDYGSLEKQMQD